MRSIALIAEKILSPALNKQNLHIKKIIFNWESIVGEDIAKFTSPLKIVKYNNKNLLHVATSNSAASAGLFYIKDTLISKISTFTGKDVVDDIKIVLKPAPSSDFIYEEPVNPQILITPEIESIKDVALQENLAKLLSHLKL